MSSYCLLIDCPDEIGLVHKITGILYNGGLNIIGNQEFVDRETSRFFMRTEFSGQTNEEAILGGLRSVLPAGAQIRLNRLRKLPIVVLVTKEHHCLGDLLIRHAYDELYADIRAVIGNHAALEPLANRFGVPFHTISHAGMERAAHEAAVMEIVDSYSPEYLVLAKYMRMLSPAFVAHYPNRIINIHHSFLPAFIGASPYRQAFQRGVKIIGATAHVVTDNLDEGPIIAQSVIPVDHTHSAADMAQAGRDVEKIVLARALQLVFEGRVFLCGNRTIIFD